MVGDGYGRPTSPACGLSSEGLFYRRDHDWEDVPERQRCPGCVQAGERLVAVPGLAGDVTSPAAFDELHDALIVKAHPARFEPSCSIDAAARRSRARMAWL